MADLLRIMDELAARRTAWMKARQREREREARQRDQEDEVRPLPVAAE